jgi:hypothetical protein
MMSTPMAGTMTHEDALALLPWYATESLEPSERDAVAAHVEGCVTCASELAELRLLDEAVSEVGSEEPAYRPALLDETMTRIERLERIEQAQATVRANFRMPTLFERARARLAVFLESFSWGALPAYARVAIVVQFVLLVALAAALVRTPTEVAYETAAGPALTTEGARFSVGFEPDATLSDVAALLERSSATIVAGPSSLGLYTVAVTDGAESASFVERARASGLVTYVAAVPE